MGAKPVCLSQLLHFEAGEKPTATLTPKDL